MKQKLNYSVVTKHPFALKNNNNVNDYEELNPNVFIAELQVDALSKLRPAKKLSYHHDYAFPIYVQDWLVSMFPSLSHDMAKGIEPSVCLSCVFSREKMWGEKAYDNCI